ncbi:MAG: hypothetical protein CM1200mP33_4750 [Chloroflexota bacterium]|nr:MAG: hypothetical protein CM1200mP33_4750 [Chloroflexota bacterium]
MNLSKTTGWLLVIGVIGGMALGFSNETASADWTSDAAMLAALSTNVDWTKLSLMLSAIAQVFIVIGMVGIRDAMSGGVGHKYASMAIWFLAIGATTNLLWSAMMGLTGDQWSTKTSLEAAAEQQRSWKCRRGQQQQQRSGELQEELPECMGYSFGIRATTNLTMFTGVTLLGIGLTMQKSLHMILAALFYTRNFWNNTKYN